MFIKNCQRTFNPSMRSRINIKKKIIVSLFLIVIGGIIFNSTFFLHSHRTACGKIIVHAHPFNKNAEKGNPISQHQHSKIDLQVFGSLHYFFNNISIIKIEHFAVIYSQVLSKPCLYYNSVNYSLYTTRGPPLINFSA